VSGEGLNVYIQASSQRGAPRLGVGTPSFCTAHHLLDPDICSTGFLYHCHTVDTQLYLQYNDILYNDPMVWEQISGCLSQISTKTIFSYTSLRWIYIVILANQPIQPNANIDYASSSICPTKATRTLDVRIYLFLPPTSWYRLQAGYPQLQQWWSTKNGYLNLKPKLDHEPFTAL